MAFGLKQRCEIAVVQMSLTATQQRGGLLASVPLALRIPAGSNFRIAGAGSRRDGVKAQRLLSADSQQTNGAPGQRFARAATANMAARSCCVPAKPRGGWWQAAGGE